MWSNVEDRMACSTKIWQFGNLSLWNAIVRERKRMGLHSKNSVTIWNVCCHLSVKKNYSANCLLWESRRNTTIRAYWEKGHRFANTSSSYSKFWVISVFSHFIKIKSFGLDNFLQWQEMLQNFFFVCVDLFSWKLCGKKGHPKRPEMWHSRGNPTSSKLPRRLRENLVTRFTTVNFA